MEYEGCWVVVYVGCNLRILHGFIHLGLLGVHIDIDMCPIVSAGLLPRGALPGLGRAGWGCGLDKLYPDWQC